jgi:hypothetical protein
MISAPLSSGIHPFDIAINLRAVLAVTGSIAIDACPIGLKAAVAVLAPIPICAGCTASREGQAGC